jgi:L-ribulose-5-phosphate 3-epimerase
MNTITFMTANFVAREVAYRMTGGWMQGDRATNAHFQPLASFPQRFEALLLSIRSIGFHALDLWTAHLNPAWATRDHIEIARRLLQQHGLKVVSLAGAFGDTVGELEAACRLAVALDVPLLGGVAPVLGHARKAAVALLQAYGLKLGLENHPERTAEEMLAQIGDGAEGALGTALDTGSYATHGYSAVTAMEKLNGHLMHIHLRDVPAPGEEESCRLGTGCVPLAACLATLQRLGYMGPLCIEHNPADHDPTEDCRASLALLQARL